MERLVLILQWVVLLPIWRRVIKSPGRQVVAAVLTGLLWIAIIIAIAGGSGGGGEDTNGAVSGDSTPLDDSGPSPTNSRGPYSSLEITDVSIEGTQVSISGKTDLPDGASVSVTFDVFGRSGDDLYIGVDGKATASGGTFGITLAVPQREEFVDGPYEVSLLFTPRNQEDQVIELVGADGENLTGDRVTESIIGFNLLEFAQRIDDLVVSVEPPSYTFDQISDFPLGSAESTLAAFVLAWRDQDWSRMANLAQKTWLSNRSDPAGELEGQYDFKTLLGFEVIDVEVISEVASDVTYVVQYEAFTNEIEKKQVTARVIKESAPLTTSVQGEWGVNPTSALSEKDVD